MKACVIFNPTARGDQAVRFQRWLPSILGPEVQLRPTPGPGTARALARDAVQSGCDTLIAAGGDGTVYEVLNGLADAADGFTRACLGVIPLGTANVFAHELGVPTAPAAAWNALRHGTIQSIDCVEATFTAADGQAEHAYFAAVAGAGLDARAVQLVDPRLKRRVGKLAYIAAALQALLRYPDLVRGTIGGAAFSGRAILVGNGRLYAGEIPVFGDGSLTSGALQVRGVRQVGPGLLLRCLQAYLTRTAAFDRHLVAGSTAELRLESARPTPLQLDGEFVGWLPATLRLLPGALRVLRPGLPSGASPASHVP